MCPTNKTACPIVRAGGSFFQGESWCHAESLTYTHLVGCYAAGCGGELDGVGRGDGAVGTHHFEVGLRWAGDVQLRQADLGRVGGPFDHFDREGHVADSQADHTSLGAERLAVQLQHAAGRNTWQGLGGDRRGDGCRRRGQGELRGRIREGTLPCAELRCSELLSGRGTGRGQLAIRTDRGEQKLLSGDERRVGRQAVVLCDVLHRDAAAVFLERNFVERVAGLAEVGAVERLIALAAVHVVGIVVVVVSAVGVARLVVVAAVVIVVQVAVAAVAAAIAAERNAETAAFLTAVAAAVMGQGVAGQAEGANHQGRDQTVAESLHRNSPRKRKGDRKHLELEASFAPLHPLIRPEWRLLRQQPRFFKMGQIAEKTAVFRQNAAVESSRAALPEVGQNAKSGV